MVTGGSRGIGRSIVESCVADGLDVAFTWRSSESVAGELEASSGGLARAFHLDLARRDAIPEVVADIERTVGPISGLVNNAGIQRSELLAMMSDSAWDEVIDTNLGGAFRCCRAVLRGMVARRRGSIVNVASLSALHGVAGHSAYAASKAGLLGLTRCLAREMGKRNIRVNAVLPGYVATDMTAGLTDEVISRLRVGECLHTGVEAGDVAAAALFLLSDRARSITGQTLIVDAGTTA
jgi:3-oxoacyl-[acyl-carrier protein] reductase